MDIDESFSKIQRRGGPSKYTIEMFDVEEWRSFYMSLQPFRHSKKSLSIVILSRHGFSK